MKRAPWEDRIVLVAGIWLFVSPFAVGTPWLSHPATVTAMVCAAMLVSCTAQSPEIPDAVQEWVVIAVSLGLQTIAEYVETEDIARKLVQIGIHLGQGYFLSPPKPWEALFETE